MATRIIFVSGIGDRKRWFYDLAARRWTGRNASAYAHIFGWDDATSDFDGKFAALLQFIDRFPDDRICLVGISAGGSATFNALVARPHIAKVALVSAPFQTYRYTHPALLESIRRANASFAAFDDASKTKLLAITGWRDRVVPPNLSLLAGVRRRRVLGLTHAMSIFVATLIQTAALRRFLKR